MVGQLNWEWEAVNSYIRENTERHAPYAANITSVTASLSNFFLGKAPKWEKLPWKSRSKRGECSKDKITV